MQCLVLMLSWSVGESHASSLLGSAISELALDHAALWICGCRNVGHLVELQEDSLKW
jgi:alpha-tubulin suppressor-like RCC1 family protein